MARGKDAPAKVGGQIDPYVQQSMQQNKQLAENRLVTAMQQTGATQRTAMQEQGAGQRASLQASTQRSIEAGRLEQNDKRAAEDEVARRDDRKFSQTMVEATQGFQAKQAELNRDQQNAIIAGDRKAKDEIEKRREALRRFNIELTMDANERTTNGMLSILKISLNKETSMEQAKTALKKEVDEYDKHIVMYTKTTERVLEAVEFDKRMDLPTPAAIKEKIPSTWDITKGMFLEGPVIGGFAAVKKYRGLKKEIKEGLADPMGVLQDQIVKYGGAISIEDLTSGTISNIVDKIQTEDIKTEDINKTFAVLEGMLNAVAKKRKAVDRDSKDYDFFQDTYLEIAQMRDNLEGLVSSDKKIKGSDKETVGSRVQYALGTVYTSSLGGQVDRIRAEFGEDYTAIFEEMTKPMQVPKLYGISPEMNKYDVEYRTWFNDYLSSRYPELQEGVE